MCGVGEGGNNFRGGGWGERYVGPPIIHSPKFPLALSMHSNDFKRTIAVTKSR